MPLIKIEVKLPQWTEWKSIHERLPVYIFPILLVVVEWIMRSFSPALGDTQTFIGPTLAAVGATYLIPLTVKKKRDYPQSIMSVLNQNGLTAVPKKEAIFITWCWILLLVFTALWALSLYLAVKSKV